MSDRTRKPKKMAAFSLAEISLVDRPAQEDALVLLAKASNDDRQATDHHEKESQMLPKSFDDAVALVCKRAPDLSRCDAMTRARRLWPELLDRYESEGAAQAAELENAKAALEKRNRAEVVEFEKFVDQVQAEHSLSRLQALQRAAREYPREKFAKYRDVMLDEE